jgi:hypothetical protein
MVPDVKLASVIVGFYLCEVELDKQPLWDARHKEWLKQCRKDFARWTSARTRLRR